jgi:hypothetical protein
MMVKLNMTVQECIKQYKELSKQIFGKPHWLGKRTMGFGTSKYSGTRLRKFIVNVMKQSTNALDPDHTMEDDTHHKKIHWYVHNRRSWRVASPTLRVRSSVLSLLDAPSLAFRQHQCR